MAGGQMDTTEKGWSALSPDEKRQVRFKRWLSPPGVQFSSPEAGKTYQIRAQRFIDALQLKEPDCVPVHIPAGPFMAYYGGSTLQKSMYDYDEARRVWLKFHREFDVDASDGPGFAFPGRVYDRLDYRMYKWPGHGLSPVASMFQFVEAEYMKADEYDVLIRDPLDFQLRYFLPRTWGLFEPLNKLAPFGSGLGFPQLFLGMVGNPEFSNIFQTLADVSKDYAKWLNMVISCSKEGIEMGFPPYGGSMASAPFDYFADYLRGTSGITMDMYRRPDKLLEAMERMVPLIVESAVAGAKNAVTPLVIMPLHKGDDGFMSDKQFETFYWPTLRKVMLGLINEGLVPSPIADGTYNRRLEVIKDLPRAATFWIFEKTDMAGAKKALGNTACLGGNVSASQLCLAGHDEVKAYCRWLIEVCGRNGGYILTPGASVDKGNPANMRALVEAAREYGRYR
jgi:hypothetical protein